MTIVVTGTLEHFKRTEIEEVIQRYGGEYFVEDGVCLGRCKAGLQVGEGEKLGVRIVHEPEFLEMIG